MSLFLFSGGGSGVLKKAQPPTKSLPGLPQPFTSFGESAPVRTLNRCELLLFWLLSRWKFGREIEQLTVMSLAKHGAKVQQFSEIAPVNVKKIMKPYDKILHLPN